MFDHYSPEFLCENCIDILFKKSTEYIVLMYFVELNFFVLLLCILKNHYANTFKITNMQTFF